MTLIFSDIFFLHNPPLYHYHGTLSRNIVQLNLLINDLSGHYTQDINAKIERGTVRTSLVKTASPSCGRVGVYLTSINVLFSICVPQSSCGTQVSITMKLSRANRKAM